jgi:Inner membrane component of T3SS, cytoplasmic domain/zinc-ribbon domain
MLADRELLCCCGVQLQGLVLVFARTLGAPEFCDGWVFDGRDACSVGGSPEFVPAEAGYVQGVRCRHCGHENELGAHFCASCGVPLSRDEADTSNLAGLGDLVEMLEADHDLAEVLAELPDGEGMLLVQRGPNAGSRYWLEASLTTVGRHADTEVFLEDMTVSRRHAVIRRGDEGYEITDVGSLNGTYLDGQRIDTADLYHLAEIQIGRFVLIFVLGGHS